MSTVDSLLIQCASTVENDILTKTFRLGLSERRRVSIARATVAIIGGICVFWGLNPPEYLAFLMYPAWGALGLSFAWVFFLGLYWRRVNKAGGIHPLLLIGGSIRLVPSPPWSPLLLLSLCGMPSGILWASITFKWRCLSRYRPLLLRPCLHPHPVPRPSLPSSPPPKSPDRGLFHFSS